MLRNSCFAFVLFLVFSVEGYGQTARFIYWVDSYTAKIQRANLDGSDIEDLVTEGLDNPEDIALDVLAGKMYWADSGTKKIQRANLDGSDIEDLVTKGLESPQDIALDLASGKMYWTNFNPHKIQRANLDGSNIEDLVTEAQGLYYPETIALHVAAGKMYWANWVAGRIKRANLDGSNIEYLITRSERLAGESDATYGDVTPNDLALDLSAFKMYWTDFGTGKIHRANLDGSNIEDLVTEALGWPEGIALDILAGKMYWTTHNRGKIQRANLDGSNIEDLVTRSQGLGNPVGIALDIVIDPYSVPIDLTVPTRADINQDGWVNIIDLLLVVSTLGDSTPAFVLADVNGDGWVTIDDVLLVIEALDDPVTGAAPIGAVDAAAQPVDSAAVEAHLNRLRSQSDGSLKYQRAIDLFQNLLLAAAPPDKTELLANYPNPFNPETWIPYRLASDADVKLTIYAINGMVVRRFDVGHRNAGYYTDRTQAVYWDGRNERGGSVVSGVYFYHLSAGDYSQTRRMLILK